MNDIVFILKEITLILIIMIVLIEVYIAVDEIIHGDYD